MKSFLIFPHQLFKNIDTIKNENPDYIILVEHPIFFGFRDISKNELNWKNPMNFNKLKLLLHKVTMLYYFDFLKNEFKTKKVIHIKIEDYLSNNNNNNNPKNEMPLSSYLSKNKITNITFFDPVDHLLNKLMNLMGNYKVSVIPSPNFISTIDTIESYIKTTKKRKYYHASFYAFQRKHFNILMTNNGSYEGGQLSFDTYNRKSLPKNIVIPKMYSASSSSSSSSTLSKYIQDSKNIIDKYFSKNIGNTENIGHLLFTHQQADDALDNFIKNRLSHFGDYEDAVDSKNPFVFHSNLSHAINIGLLDPMEVIKKVENAYRKNKSLGIHNTEGFIRQILGWREYIRMLYIKEYDNIKGQNAFGFKKMLNDKWYNGTTGFPPIDDTIKQAIDIGYLHHIQRLMFMGNFMTLCQIHPDEVYKWFMEYSIDSYDWVMIANVYSMVAHSDAGLAMTKPYVSSDNYILKMSDYKKGEWCEKWRALYYNFIGNAKIGNKLYFKENPRTKIMYSHWNKLSSDEKNKLVDDANEVIKEL